VAGAGRVLVLALTDGSDMTEGMMTSAAGQIQRELTDLRASGSEVMVRVPAQVDFMELMSPTSVPRALEMGAHQAADDARALTEFWG